MLQKSDYQIIGKAISGFRLPYSTYSDDLVESILAHKRNNFAALSACNNGVLEYLANDSYDAQMETVNGIFDEMAKFCLYGLLGIGYFGVSVEDGMPKKVDSTGANVGKLYGSAYETMTRAEYEALDRIDSMLLDQRDNRRFGQYLRALQAKLASSFVSKLIEAEKVRTDAARKCLSLDEMFCMLLIKMGRSSENMGIVNYSIMRVEKTTLDIDGILSPYRPLLSDKKTTNLRDYTQTDLKPIVPRMR